MAPSCESEKSLERESLKLRERERSFDGKYGFISLIEWSKIILHYLSHQN